MTAPALPLADIAQQLSQKQSEIEALRLAYEQRLQGLQQRKQELEAELRELDTEIRVATKKGSSAVSVAAPAPQVRRQLKAAVAVPELAAKQTLFELLVAIVGEKGRPVKVAELVDELVRREYPTTSTNLPKMIGIKVADLVNRGLLKRAEGEEGVTLPQAKAASKKPAKAAATQKTASNGHVSGNGSSTAKPRKLEGLSLREVLGVLLSESKKPMKAKDLATQALARGYKTKSETFVDVVWTALGQMKDVENVHGEGYRLKRAATKAK
jgi:DNA-binding transcriptional MerR regulator